MKYFFKGQFFIVHEKFNTLNQYLIVSSWLSSINLFIEKIISCSDFHWSVNYFVEVKNTQ